MSSRTLLIVFAMFKVALHLATSEGYGYFRDELYYIACSKHLDWGYVDHPAFSVVVLRAVRAILGDSLLAIRLVPALAGAGTVALVGAMAAALGGGRFAQALAMTAACIAPVYLGASHVYSMNGIDILLWSVAAYFLIRIGTGGDRRLWLALGAVLALGLANKISVLWLGAGLAVGLVATPDRRWLATRWPFVAAAMSFVGLAPYLVWQLMHDWATLEFIGNATSEKMIAIAPLDFLIGQIQMMHPFTAPIWISGLGFYFIAQRGRPWRALGWIYVTVLGILIGFGTSRTGYLAPAYTWLFAGGAVWIEPALTRRRWQATVIIVLLVGGALRAPFSLPLLPIETYLHYAKALGRAPSTEEKKELGALGQFYADMHGWDDIVEKLSVAYTSLPEDEKSSATFLAPDYGIAGAIDLMGARYGLPAASSGHNNYWHWGPPERTRTFIVIGGSASDLERWFSDVEQSREALDCGYCMPYENRRSVWIARGLKTSLAELWKAIRHYD